MPKFVDDKTPLVIPFLLSRLAQHRASPSATRPFVLGLNGIQGAGKTTLVAALERSLSQPPHNHTVLPLSIDDLYLPHAAQRHLARSNPSNPLLQHRGQPGTHDVSLGADLLAALADRRPAVRVPSYDKSAHNGAGDRVPADRWSVVNRPGEPTVDIVLFEGWCVGFRPLSADELRRRWERAREELRAREEAQGDGDDAAARARMAGRLGRQEFENVERVNEYLKAYDCLTDRLDAFVQIDAEDYDWVYAWRSEQETELRATKGTGMTDEQVVGFVNGYYPSYELFADALRDGIFKDKGRQLRLAVGRDRTVKSHEII